MAYLIRDATIGDVYVLARTLREADRRECEAYGVAPGVGLRKSFYASTWRRCALIDGSIAAMWGICGTSIGHTAQAWLMTAPVIEKLPVAFVREARREVETMLATHSRIEGTVAKDYLQAIRFLRALGFEIGPLPENKGGGFRTFSMERRMPGRETT